MVKVCLDESQSGGMVTDAQVRLCVSGVDGKSGSSGGGR